VDLRVFGIGVASLGDRFYWPTRKRYAAFDTAGTMLWLGENNGSGQPEPAVGVDGVLYSQGGRWGVHAVNPDGTQRWYRRHYWGTEGLSEQPRWPWYGGPALAQDGTIYAAGLHAFWAYSTAGDSLWTYEADSAGVPQAFTGAPAIGPDGTVYTFTSTHIYAFFGPSPPEPDSPWPMWRHDAQRTGWAR
jgi:outer membrane protein assembly factor BamB